MGILMILVESLTRVLAMPNPTSLHNVIEYTDVSRFTDQKTWCFHGFREGALEKISSCVQGLGE